MKDKRILYDGRGKGEWSYDYKHDILTLKIKDLKYDYSIELEDYVIDFDPQGIVKGIQLWDASKVLETSKSILNQLYSFHFLVAIKEGKIQIKVFIIVKYRNKELKVQQDIERVLEQEQAPLEVSCSTK